MTSLIKVDSIQTSAGGTPTASSLGIGGVGKIGQVVSSVFSTTFSTTSTSFVTTGHSASITPSSTSSKVLILLNGGEAWNNNDVNYGRWTTIYRGATDLGAGTNGLQKHYANTFLSMPHSINYLDSPSTTSSTTYTVYHRTQAGTTWYNHDGGTGVANKVSLTLLEVLA